MFHPADLNSRYQHFTEAAIAGLHAARFRAQFTEREAGIKKTFAA